MRCATATRPTLARWVHSGDYRLEHWETNWSSQTGACQAGILHGSNQDMPAFRWWEKDQRQAIVTIHPHDAAELERRHSDREREEFCGNQRSMKAASAGLIEDDYRDLINFESSKHYNEKQKAALSYAEAITWDLPVDDKFWARLHKHFSEPELVEIGYFVALTMGQQRWLRTLNIEHHQILAGTDASMAPGFEDEEALQAPKRRPTTGRSTSSRAQRPSRRIDTANDRIRCAGDARCGRPS